MKKNKLGISDIETLNISFEKRIEIYKRIGFDFVSIDWKKDLKTNLEKIDLIKKHNFYLDDIHLEFETANDLWLKENNNDYVDYCKKSLEEISTIKNIGSDVVIHITKTFNPPPINSIGIVNIKNLVNFSKSLNLNLCFENLKRPDYLEEIIKSLSNLNLSICYDSGHAHCYMEKPLDFIKLYSSNIKTTHLHDNFKDFDSHLSLMEGNINWGELISELIKIKLTKFHLEVFPKNREISIEEFENFVSKNFERIKELLKKSV